MPKASFPVMIPVIGSWLSQPMDGWRPWNVC